MKSLTIKVSDVTSYKDIRKIRRLIYNVEGITFFIFNFESGQLVISFYEEYISKEELIEKIEELGYTIIG